jgi:hypothetical protein
VGICLPIGVAGHQDTGFCEVLAVWRVLLRQVVWGFRDWDAGGQSLKPGEQPGCVARIFSSLLQDISNYGSPKQPGQWHSEPPEIMDSIAFEPSRQADRDTGG